MSVTRKNLWASLFFVALIGAEIAYSYIHSAPQRAAEKQRLAKENADVAENSRILSKCEALPEQLWGACISLVTNYRITKPEAICRQTSGAIDYNACMRNFQTAGVTEACAAMAQDPDLAPACQNVTNHR
jgi:hypothetical protein